MGPQELVLILPLLFLACFHYGSNGNSMEERPSVGHLAQDSPFNRTAHHTDFSGENSSDGKFGSYEPKIKLLGSSSEVVNVKDFGATGDGSTDDTTAFVNAWKVTCSSSVTATLLVPEKKIYLLKPITFSGPCKSGIIVIKGIILASPNRSDWDGKDRRQWVTFNVVKNLRVEGGGTFYGNGEIWWKNSCKFNKSLPCEGAPTALTFHKCSRLKVDSLRFKDSQQMHVNIMGCSNVHVSNLVISAPGTSPNTDGIHVTGTTNIQISNCVIGTGDDCISIVGGSQYVTATNIVCGPGHGISIGSLGYDGSVDIVSDVLVDTAQFEGTTNGVRIKTWQGGKGYAKKIIFKNAIMKNVRYPIIIDQNYCISKPCSEQKSAVAISGVTYQNITGTSATAVAMYFDCSKSIPCKGILLQDINLVPAGGRSARVTCNNVNLYKSGNVIPSTCTRDMYYEDLISFSKRLFLQMKEYYRITI